MTTQSNVSVISKGGVSGYFNTVPEIKTSGGGATYMNVLLGRGKKKGSEEFLPAYSLVAYDNVAKLIEATVKKGDLIRVTKVGFAIVKDENFDKYNIAQKFTLVVEEFEKIEVNQNRQSNQPSQSQAPQQSAPQQRQSAPQQRQAAPQPTPQQATPDNFDDDIPF